MAIASSYGLLNPTITSSTNLGPMITPLTFPADCSDNLYDMNTGGFGVPWTYWTQGCAISTCCPSKNFYTTAFAWYSSYYSPAVCPYAYQTCPGPAILSGEPGEVIEWCCPDGYDCPPTGNATGTSHYLNGFCQQTTFPISTAYVVDNIIDQKVTNMTTVTQFYNAAYPLQIRWKSGDFDTTPTITSTGSTATSLIPSTPSPTTTSVPVATQQAVSTSHGLSTGSIVAIAVVVGIVFLSALAAFIWWKRKVVSRDKHDDNEEVKLPPNQAFHGYKAELETNVGERRVGEMEDTAKNWNNRAEPHGKFRTELDGNGRSELGEDGRLLQELA